MASKSPELCRLRSQRPSHGLETRATPESPHLYKLHLILKYLRRRRIAWVSLLAVMLCTTMVIVVISIMGGWLRMYERNARGMTGDIVVRAVSLSGFPHYDEMVEKIEKLPYVDAAVPQISVKGLATIYNGPTNAVKTDGVQVFGIQIDRASRVNDWPDSLYLQHTKYIEEGKTPPQKESFDTHRTSTVIALDQLPDEFADVPYAMLGGVFRWLPTEKRIPPSSIWSRLQITLGQVETPDGVWQFRWILRLFPAAGQQYVTLNDADVQALEGLSSDKKWISRVRALDTLTNRPGLIAGSRLIDVRRDASGKIVGRADFKYRDVWVKLTVLGIGKDEQVRLEQKSEPEFWVIDDSRTGMWQYDNNSIYVDFFRIQKELNMDAKYSNPEKGTFRSWLGMRKVDPARTSEINIRLKPGTNIDKARDGIDDVVQSVMDDHIDAGNYDKRPHVDTWRQASATYLSAIEKEKGLVVLLFGIISIVAVFLIFCIFYMIVAEKTRDIGIIKSVGATNLGVAGIFLGYGLVIGMVGAGLGLMLSYLLVHNINEIHDFMGRTLHVVVWNPEVYAFDTIPNEMQPNEVIVILLVAVMSSVLGALVPAIQAARKHPVDALRSE
jgi:lipoprotein-releasing system permease protein